MFSEWETNGEQPGSVVWKSSSSAEAYWKQSSSGGRKKHHFLYLQRFENEAGATGVGIVLMPSHAALQVDARGINEITGLGCQTLGKGGTGHDLHNYEIDRTSRHGAFMQKSLSAPKATGQASDTV